MTRSMRSCIGSVTRCSGCDVPPICSPWLVGVARSLRDPGSEATALHGLGDTAQGQGDYSTARQHYSDALALYRQIGARHYETIASAALNKIS
jgi:hypothetical protein